MTKKEIELLLNFMDSEIQKTKESNEYSVYSDFDLEKHKENFTNYLEVVIREDGKVEYAVPSHQEKLISIVMEKHNLTRDELMEKSSESNYVVDFIDWLCNESGCISIWTNWMRGTPNDIQKQVLYEFKENGIFHYPFE